MSTNSAQCACFSWEGGVALLCLKGALETNLSMPGGGGNNRPDVLEEGRPTVGEGAPVTVDPGRCELAPHLSVGQGYGQEKGEGYWVIDTN